MKNSVKRMPFLIAILIFPLIVISQKEVTKSFASKEIFSISTVSGNCKIEKSSDNKINVKLIYTYDDDCFKYSFEESTGRLNVKEEFEGSCKGYSNWIIGVPVNTEIEFNTASGDIEIAEVQKGVSGNTASGNIKMKNLSGKLDLNTASGDVVLVKMEGDLKMNSASGNVKIESLTGKASIVTASGDIDLKNSTGDIDINVASGNVQIQSAQSKLKFNSASGNISVTEWKGEIQGNTASGNIESDRIEITGKSSINTASGDVSFDLAKPLTDDLKLTTASGNATIDYNGGEITGFFEFTARVDKGEIISPFKFDKEEIIELDGKKYDKKSFTKGSSNPKIIIKTSSGDIKLVK
ncbi:MAG: DUF4097 family beta strand repeat-containing protein [Bacteroidales bacterium]